MKPYTKYGLSLIRQHKSLELKAYNARATVFVLAFKVVALEDDSHSY